MDTKAVRPGTPQPVWTVPQAIAWIVGRSALSVERVTGVRSLYTALQRLLDVHPVSHGNQLPISLDRAPLALIQSAQTRGLTILGSLMGKAEPEPVPVGSLSAPRLCDREGKACIEDNSPFANRNNYWTDLWVHAEECMSEWPAPVKAEGFAQDAASSEPRATDAQMREWMDQHQHSLKSAGKLHGRDVILDAAKKKFGVRRKVVLDIWSKSSSVRNPGGTQSRQKST
jgi:hypothetical protein